MTFTSGRIAKINGQAGDLKGFHKTLDSNGHELEAYVNVAQEFVDLDDNVIARTGLAAKQTVEERDDIELQNDDLQIGRTEDIRWKWTNYWVVPDEIIVVGNADGEFAFDLLSDTLGTDVQKVRFNLSAIMEDFPGQWMGSFEDRQDNVQRGTLYGDRIEDDADMGRAFRESSKPQIGPWIDYRNQELKVRIGRDGWAQVVSPGTYNREKYLSLVRDVLLNYTI